MSQSPFALAAPSLIGMGYSPIPIAPRCDRKPLFEGDRPPEGKTPGRFKPARDGTRYWFGFKQWKAFCKQQAHPSAITDWASWPDAGVGVCCGYGGLLAIDVDNPDLIEPIRAILPPILVEKFGRKGFTAFYRSEHSRNDEEWWKKKNYKNADKRGLLDFLAATLLNTPLEALPLFTDAHRAEMERVCFASTVGQLLCQLWRVPGPLVNGRCVHGLGVWQGVMAVGGQDFGRQSTPE